ncbi:saccharopine dehydrogenase [Microbacterium sp. SGAir0570]|uniref:saccharopine dehydrogenase n=1 Tax=Microbacterium sp. SGAir0570 TaxID=2070348 RepID=UPI0010CD6099|nr:saccharopine dehydrogenase [Microbacterium sp. SGAir0570]QCR41341.1 saccharopine dehydrogenase [Microbacterium sp. SGAir0570]
MSQLSVLVLGSRGAVGAAAADALRAGGHAVVGASRRPGPGGLAVDVTTLEGREVLAAAARRADAVIDASGLEITAVQEAVGSTPLVDVSATASHLARLAGGVADGGAVLLGAGIAPGVSTVLASALGAAPGDDVDVTVMLGAGESHGAAAVDWTVRLAGAPLYAAPEAERIVNLRSVRRFRSAAENRRYLRADFPDDLLWGSRSGVAVRSWLALDSRVATAALRTVGVFPLLAPLLRRAPHLGTSRWRVGAVHRQSGRRFSASGEGQSLATGRMAALAATRMVERGVRGVVTMADVVGVDDIRGVAGIGVDRGEG